MTRTQSDPASRIASKIQARSLATGRKIRRAWGDRTLGGKLRRRASNALYVPVRSLLDDRRLAHVDRNLDLKTGFADHRGTDHEARVSDSGLQRIIDAFIAAEADRGGCPPALEVRGVWAEWLDLYYTGLRNLLRARDISGLRRLLENVHRDPMSTGSGGTYDDTNRLPGFLGRAYYRVLWCRSRDLLQALRGDYRDVASPIAGNPHGVWIGGRLIYPDTLRHAYYATSLLKSLEDDDVQVLEIGAGLGGQATQLLELGKGSIVSYTILDLPEVACLSAYCLMASMGEENVSLFGEPASRSDALVQILPHWRIAALPDNCVDLVFNSYSFSEMDASAATFYLHEIERLTRRYFFHINHETRFRYRQPDGSVSVNRIGSEMAPDPTLFHLKFQRVTDFVRLEGRANRAFEYLYCRKSSSAPQNRA